MAQPRATLPTFTVTICDDPDIVGALRFTFVPTTDRRSPAKGKPLQPRAHYVVSVQGHGDKTDFHWIQPPESEATRDMLEAIARQRVSARHEWLEKLRKLVATAKGWADELDWATRIVDKNMEDSEIGSYQAPGLLLQKETVRLFLEPVARAAPGTQGVVDLYRMPSYDDVAGLYYSNDRWNLQYLFGKAPAARDIRVPEAKALTKATLRKVLDEMVAHAG